MQLPNCAQGFGKAKNRVGMKRPKKSKVEAAETMSEDDSEGENDTGVTGEQLPSLEPATTADREKPVLSAAAEKKLEAATDVFVEAEVKAEALREIATEHEQKERLAQRLHDAKMRRLESGDKLKRRKTGFGASMRTYEAIIWLQHEQLACARARCAAAEAERDAAKAELRLNDNEPCRWAVCACVTVVLFERASESHIPAGSNRIWDP